MDKRRLDKIKKYGTLFEYNEALKEFAASEIMDYKLKPTCRCEECKKSYLHRSDCAVHNEPAERNGECNCIN